MYKRAKIKALERGETLRQVVLAALARDLDAPVEPSGKTSFAQRRSILPAFAVHEAKGAYQLKSGQRDITQVISEDRDEW